MEAVEKAGYEPGEQVVIAIDAAASELYDKEKGVYYFPGESRMKGEEICRDSQEMIAYYERLTAEFPIVSIEDGLEEDDWEGWKNLTESMGDKIQLVGDDLFVTNKKRLACGIRMGTANAILVKVNQIGTLSEALDAVEMAQKNGYRAVDLHRIRGNRGLLYCSIWPLPQGQARSKQERPAVQTGMPSTTSLSGSKKNWENRLFTKILLEIIISGCSIQELNP